MNNPLSDNVKVGFVVRSPLTGKLFYCTDKFEDACRYASLIEHDKKQTEIVVVPLIVNNDDIPFRNT